MDDPDFFLEQVLLQVVLGAHLLLAQASQWLVANRQVGMLAQPTVVSRQLQRCQMLHQTARESC